MNQGSPRIIDYRLSEMNGLEMLGCGIGMALSPRS
jgi:hypothetical protein